MPRIVFICLTTLIWLTSCVDMTEYADATSEISGFYGGSITCGKGVSTSTSEGKAKYLTVTLSQTPALDYGINPEFLLSHMAMAFYRDMSDEHLENFTHIESTLEVGGGRTYESMYEIQDLEYVYTKSSELRDLLKHVDERDIEAIRTSVIPQTQLALDTSNVYEFISEGLDTLITDAVDYLFTGHRYVTVPDMNDKECLEFCSHIIGPDRIIRCTMVLDHKKEEGANIINLYFN